MILEVYGSLSSDVSLLGVAFWFSVDRDVGAVIFVCFLGFQGGKAVS